MNPRAIATAARRALFDGLLVMAAAQSQEGPAPYTANTAPPPERDAITSGGVDIRTGRMAFNKMDLSIGGGNGGIALGRMMPIAIGRTG